MPRSKSGARTATDFIMVEDMDGNEVKIPLLQLMAMDKRHPQADADGTVPEFVNISGKVQQMSQGYPHADKTSMVPPYGILRGAQWREYSEPARAWGDNPMFMERKQNKDGGFDKTYLLTPTQINLECGRIKSWRWGPRRLKMLRKNGKKQEYDKIGRSQIDVRDLYEDRAEVIKTIDNRLEELEAVAAVERKAEIGSM